MVVVAEVMGDEDSSDRWFIADRSSLESAFNVAVAREFVSHCCCRCCSCRCWMDDDDVAVGEEEEESTHDAKYSSTPASLTVESSNRNDELWESNVTTTTPFLLDIDDDDVDDE